MYAQVLSSGEITPFIYTYIPDENGNYYIVVDGDPYDGKKFGLMNAKGRY